ncbi:MAG: hypothetical protein HY860_01045 [Chlamydiales bacterium]|nr:hypothetical protein [Chlamydiales bacterium]
MSTLFYLGNHIQGVEDPWMNCLGKGLQLLGCGDVYEIEFNEDQRGIEVTSVERIAKTVCDIALGIFMLVTVLPTILAFVAKLISRDDRISTIFDKVLNSDDTTVRQTTLIIPPSPICPVSDDKTVDFTLYQTSIIGLSRAPTIEQAELDKLQDAADTANYRFEPYTHQESVLTEARRLFPPGDETLKALELMGNKVANLDDNLSHLNDNNKLANQIRTKIRLFSYLLITSCKDDTEKRVILVRLSAAANVCMETYEKEFADLAMDIFFKRPDPKDTNNLALERILYLLQTLKLQILLSNFASGFRAPNGKTLSPLGEWHFIDTIKYILGKYLGLPSSTARLRGFGAVDSYKDHINPTNILFILKQKYTPQLIIESVKDLLNATDFPKTSTGNFLVEHLSDYLEKKSEEIMRSGGEGINPYVYVDEHYKEGKQGTLTNEDIAIVLTHLEILAPADSDTGEVALVEQMNEDWEDKRQALINELEKEEKRMIEMGDRPRPGQFGDRL